MAAPLGNQFAVGNKGGNPGAGKLNAVRQKIDKYHPLWWERWLVMMDSDDKQERFEAMREFNKLQCKMIPTQITGEDGQPISVNIINYAGNNIAFPISTPPIPDSTSTSVALGI